MAAEPTFPQLVTFSNFNLNKLTQDNYPTWLPQVIPHLKGGNLFGYVDGSIPCPRPSITTVKEHISSTTMNLAYLHWEMQDQIILGFLTSAISERMISHVASCKTSNQAWTKVETLFASQSKARILNVYFQLATLKKANLSIVDYFHKFQTLIDALATVNKPLSDLEKQLFLLARLGSEYTPFVTFVTTRTDILSIKEIYAHLLAHELYLEQTQPAMDVSDVAVHLASQNPPHRGGCSNRGGYYNFGRGSSFNRGGYRGYGRGSFPTGRGSYNRGSSSTSPLC
ncbi:uncharacterized protein LOC132163015 [Corylus avellana]|uniref:uncharacterized protein LOC132163015 n=1 Tax=Corylus avellana TaxID=13451 RepID=UPI00286BE86A|nr:uncharacterized protein LOC132163015 [Corylus avellana]